LIDASLRRAFSYVVPQARRLVLVLVVSLVSTGLSLYLPLLSRDLVDKAPSLDRASAVWADTLVMAAEQGETLEETNSMLDKTMAYVDRVLATDPANALVHGVRGHAAMLKWDWRGTDEETKRGIELCPTHERVGYHRTFSLMLEGRFDEGIASAEGIHGRNPNPRLGSSTLAWHYLYARRWSDVIRVVEPVIDRFDYTNEIETVLATLLPQAYAEMARFDDALRIADQIAPKLDPYALSSFVGVYAMAGRIAQAKATRANIEDKVDLGTRAYMADALGETDAALGFLEQVVAGHNVMALFLKVERYSPQLRSHPRFQALLKTVGFP